MDSTTNINDLTSTSLSSQMVSVIHDALDSYPVMIFNGQPEAHEARLGSALTSISLDLRNVKIQVGSHTQLLSGIKQRREVATSLSNTFKKFGEYIGLNKKWKWIIYILQTAASAYGAYQLITKVFFPEAPVLPHK